MRSFFYTLKSGLLILGLFFALPSCKNDKAIICTQEYKMLTVTIKNSNGDPVYLWWYSVSKKSTGEGLDFSHEDPYQDSINRTQGIYTIFTDGLMDMTTREGMEFDFLMMNGSMPVVIGTYLIGKDDCHCLLLAGNTEIVLNN